jgi:hypothetical protein
MTWRRITFNGEVLRDLGVLPNGEIHNPNGYDEALVRTACRYAEDYLHARRSASAKKAAVTKARRQELRVHRAAARFVERKATGPRSHCFVCGKGLTDAPSIARGIGSDCWQSVLTQITYLTQSTIRENQPVDNSLIVSS